jgi:alcohol dehydrogenase class IV
MSSTALGPPTYDFVAPGAIVFGLGRIAELGGVTARFGDTAWIVTSGSGLAACGGRAAVETLLAASGVSASWVGVASREPTVADVAALISALPARGVSRPVMLAIGGGSAIDLAKVAAALCTNVGPDDRDAEQAVLDRLEGVGRGLPIRLAPLPLVAVPTTAGTGAEATRNAVVSCPTRRFKKSMRSPLMVPRAAIVDPALTVSCPQHVSAAAGLDAITQLIEAFVCRFAAPLPSALVLDALPRAVAALPRVLADGGDLEARAAMSHAALLSGMALTNSGLGMAHGVAAALGVECGTPHGVACGLMLPIAVRVNRPVCRDGFATLERAIDAGASADPDVAADAFVRRIDRLTEIVGGPRRLAEVGLTRDRITWLAANSGGASMRGNPVELPPEVLEPLLHEAY